MYATKHLRVLLRASVEFFSSWGMELLVTQLHDHSKAVSLEALDILDEACEDKVTAVKHMRPTEDRQRSRTKDLFVRLGCILPSLLQ